jgi:hypothetical protein
MRDLLHRVLAQFIPTKRVTNAVNLKFLSLLAASSFRNFKLKTALES